VKNVEISHIATTYPIINRRGASSQQR